MSDVESNDAFSDWNLRLLNEYFSAAAGEQVWLTTSKEQIDSFGLDLGGASGLLEVIKAGPSWVDWFGADLSTLISKLVEQRQANARVRPARYIDPGDLDDNWKLLDAPAYLPLIAVIVWAASEVSGDGFYNKVQMMTELKFDGQEARNSLSSIFHDLESWTNLLDGELGYFKARSLGAHKFVGLAKSQALLTGRDVDGLDRLFAAAGLSSSQIMTNEIFHHLVDLAEGAYFLSNSFKQALSDRSEFGEVLKDVVAQRLEQWDGGYESAVGRVGSKRHENTGSSVSMTENLRMILQPTYDGFKLGWRGGGHPDAVSTALEFSDLKIEGRPDNTGEEQTFMAESHDALELVERAFGEDVVFSMRHIFNLSEDNSQSRESIFPASPVRNFVWDAADEEILIERELPVCEETFLLTNRPGQLDYLKREGLELNPVEIDGLPPHWSLVSIEKVEQLSSQHWHCLQTLLSEPQRARLKGRLKFLGGSPIRRGMSKQYPDYGLPLVELEGPPFMTLKADGIHFEQVGEESQNRKSFIRRYRIKLIDSQETKRRSQFKIAALDAAGRPVHSLRLKVSPEFGMGISHGRGSLNAFGEFTSDAAHLSGAILAVQTGLTEAPYSSQLPMKLLGEREDTDVPLSEQRSPVIELLDVLAQKGTLIYGQARDFLKDREVKEVIGVILDLSSRGFLEIEKDSKGHLKRLHGTPPAFYKTDFAGAWYGLAGTLRREQWKWLLSLKSGGAHVYTQSVGEYLPTVRVQVSDIIRFQDFCRRHEFVESRLTGRTLGSWARDLTAAETRLRENKGYENFEWRNIEKWRAQDLRFKREQKSDLGFGSNLLRVERSRGRELFRMDDPVVKNAFSHIIGTVSEQDTSFHYIQDTRWGVWLAFNGFLKAVARHMPEAHPWPIPYKKDTGSIFLPARLRPPLLLDRALIMGSGSPPLIFAAAAPVDRENEASTSLTLRRCSEDTPSIGRISMLYSDMLSGLWLEYPAICPELANTVAAKLECRIDPILDQIPRNQL